MSESSLAIVGVVTSIVALPLTLLTFYLKGQRDSAEASRRELARRIDGIERDYERLRIDLTDLERSTTTKEEWLREGLSARRSIESLEASVVRMAVLMEARGCASGCARIGGEHGTEAGQGSRKTCDEGQGRD